MGLVQWVAKSWNDSDQAYTFGASLVGQMVKKMPAMQETGVQSLGQEAPWGREWQPSPVFLPAKFHGQKSLAGYSPWGPKESDMTERPTL